MNKLFLSIIILLHLTSCGVKGDLYLPVYSDEQTTK